MRRFAGPLSLALVAALPAVRVPALWPLFAALAAFAVGAAVAAVRLRSSGLVVWAVLAAAAGAALAAAAHGPAAGAWALGLGLLLLLGAELTFATARGTPAALTAWRWEYFAAALSAVALSLVPRVSAGAGSALPFLGLAAVGALVALLALLVVRSPR